MPIATPFRLQISYHIVPILLLLHQSHRPLKQAGFNPRFLSLKRVQHCHYTVPFWFPLYDERQLFCGFGAPLRVPIPQSDQLQRLIVRRSTIAFLGSLILVSMVSHFCHYLFRSISSQACWPALDYCSDFCKHCPPFQSCCKFCLNFEIPLLQFDFFPSLMVCYVADCCILIF